MSLTGFIEVCGGIENVTRILVPDDCLLFEVRELALITMQDDKLSSSIRECIGIDTALSQLAFNKPTSLSDADLLDVGKRIALRQTEMASHCALPTECEYRPQWHIAPPQGLLNDPNGFVFHQGQYHLFYQWSPYSCLHKDKYWAHLTSTDMVNWHTQPLALTPSDWFDSHGVFSGHAVSHGDELMLFYTGNTRIGEQRDRHTTQCLAVSKDGVHFDKKGPVIATLPPEVTPHCRDPKVIYHNNEWLMLLGAQREDLIGRLAVYKSSNLHDWSFHDLCGDEMGEFGYMWECPDLFALNGQWLAVIGPQGIQSSNPHHTVPHHNGIFHAQLSAAGDITLSEFSALDHGFDFYAPQTLETPDGRRVLVGWMGLPDEVNQPSVVNGWVHQLTGLRELTYQGGQLIQQPIREQQQQRQARQEMTLTDSSVDLHTKSFELKVDLAWDSELALFKDDNNELLITLDRATRILRLDRSRTLLREGDTVRELVIPEHSLHLAGGDMADKVALHILADASSVEIFINHGEFVMTSRVFTPKAATRVSVTGQATLEVWALSAMHSQ
ncbi:glycoside hydrolase family 32 protein [Vibrio sp. E150_011]